MLNKTLKPTCAPFQKPLVLAPLRGVTGAIFRNVFFKHFAGFHSAMAPFISTVKGASFTHNHIRDILPDNNCNHIVIPQIIGNDSAEFLIMAKTIAEYGYSTINWNLGCPAPMVAGKKRGSGLLKHPDLIKQLLDEILPSLPTKLSIKTRLGFDSTHELLKILPLFEAYPISEITIHARSAIQMYKGVVDISAFNECLDACTVPVGYNGDITSIPFFESLVNKFTKISSFMIGRGAIANPFLAEELCGCKREDSIVRAERVRLFIVDIYDEYKKSGRGGSALLGVMKELWQYLAPSFKNGSNLLKSIRHSNSTSWYEKNIDDYFVKNPQFDK